MDDVAITSRASAGLTHSFGDPSGEIGARRHPVGEGGGFAYALIGKAGSSQFAS